MWLRVQSEAVGCTWVLCFSTPRCRDVAYYALRGKFGVAFRVSFEIGSWIIALQMALLSKKCYERHIVPHSGSFLAGLWTSD